ncbi:LppX_LprAFG lipoprotein [Mumia zhuanghuii]|uniref:DUF6612 family protein n=2 Tax=Mumia TaxID=1546255 RepID=A0ABW1QP84_9ACTN|nr:MULTISPECIES: DUF6612 family protein [Mumia]KAA1422231.1 LppX_LprAFG lipoprotein [Mumia zhuanghuii]
MRMRTLSTAVAAIGLALVAGCGSSADVVSDASGSSQETSSSSQGSGDGSDSTTTLTAANFAEVVAGAQTDAQSTHMTMSMDIAGQSIDAEADLTTDADPAKTAMRMSMDMGGQAVEMLMVDGAIYTQAPGMPEGKWMKIDLDEAAGAAGGSFAQLRESIDPAQSIKNLKDSLKDLKDTGETATIDGVEAKRYDAVVDTSKLADLPAAAGAQLPDEITYQYWVGPDNLPRKIVLEGLGTPMEMTFSKWGEKVEVTAPSPDSVIDGSSMLGG